MVDTPRQWNVTIGPQFQWDAYKSLGVDISLGHRISVTDNLRLQFDVDAQIQGLISSTNSQSLTAEQVLTSNWVAVEDHYPKDGYRYGVTDGTKSQSRLPSLIVPIQAGLLWRPTPSIEVGPVLSIGFTWKRFQDELTARLTGKNQTCDTDDVFCSEAPIPAEPRILEAGPFQGPNESWGLLFGIGGRFNYYFTPQHHLSVNFGYQNAVGDHRFIAGASYGFTWDVVESKSAASPPTPVTAPLPTAPLPPVPPSSVIASPLASSSATTASIPPLAPAPIATVAVPVAKGTPEGFDDLPPLKFPDWYPEVARRKVESLESKLDQHMVLILSTGQFTLSYSFIKTFAKDTYIQRALKKDIKLILQSADHVIRLFDFKLMGDYSNAEKNTVIMFRDFLEMAQKASSHGSFDQKEIEAVYEKNKNPKGKSYYDGIEAAANMLLWLLAEADYPALPTKSQLDYFDKKLCNVKITGMVRKLIETRSAGPK